MTADLCGKMGAVALIVFLVPRPILGATSMASSIGRGDPEYEAAMREAKALFEAAMAKGAMKARGRPRVAAAGAPGETAEAPGSGTAGEAVGTPRAIAPRRSQRRSGP
jgi:hypothetical protein